MATKESSRLVLAVLLLLACGAKAPAERITLKNGKVYHGKKAGASDTRRAFIIDGKLRWFRIAEIRSVTADDAGEFKPPKPPVGPKPSPGRKASPRFFLTTKTGCLLSIPDRKQDPTVHATGKYPGCCGEASLHMGLLHYGVWVSQRMVWEAGKSEGVTSGWLGMRNKDFSRALEKFGLTCSRWVHRKEGLDKYVAWLRGQLRAGCPVLVGMRQYPRPPTYPKEWPCDHFALIVGYDDKGVVVNTNWGRQEKRTWGQVTSVTKGLSFKNEMNLYYGCAITGVRSPETTLPVHLYVRGQTNVLVDLEVHVDTMTKRKRYTLLRFDCPKGVAPKTFDPKSADWSRSFAAKKTTDFLVQRIPRHRIAIYRCVPAR